MNTTTIQCHGQTFEAHTCDRNGCGFKTTDAHDMIFHQAWHAVKDDLGVAHNFQGRPVFVVKGRITESYKVW